VTIVIEDTGLRVVIPDGVRNYAVVSIEQSRGNLRIQANCPFQAYPVSPSADSIVNGKLKSELRGPGNILELQII